MGVNAFWLSIAVSTIDIANINIKRKDEFLIIAGYLIALY